MGNHREYFAKATSDEMITTLTDGQVLTNWSLSGEFKLMYQIGPLNEMYLICRT